MRCFSGEPLSEPIARAAPLLAMSMLPVVLRRAVTDGRSRLGREVQRPSSYQSLGMGL